VLFSLDLSSRHGDDLRATTVVHLGSDRGTIRRRDRKNVPVLNTRRIPMDDTTTFDLPSTECALITHDDMEGLEFKFPNPEHQDLENSDIPVPQLMAFLAACYYRWNRDPEFVRSMMDWCEKHLQNTLGRDIEDRLASSDDDNGNDNGNGNGDGYNGNGYANGNGGHVNGNGNGYRRNGYANGYHHDYRY
jgi:hypothetical protein